MEDTLPLVYISVLNWNGADDTIRCLESLAHLNYPNFKIIIVDNASADDSIQQIEAAFPQLPIIRSAENLGYAGGNRLALEKAVQDRADLFWILNNDTLVEPDALMTLVEAYHRNGAALYGSVALESVESRVVRFGGGWSMDAEGRPVIAGKYNPLRGQNYDTCFADKQDRKVAAVNGSSLMIPTSLVQQHGFMDETYFHSGEEVDYCFRLWKKGVPTILVPTSLVIHAASASARKSPQIAYVLKYYQTRNKLEFIRRYSSRKTYFVAVYQQLRPDWKMHFLALFRPSKVNTRVPEAYYKALAIRHALLRRTGKTFAPEDFLE